MKNLNFKSLTFSLVISLILLNACRNKQELQHKFEPKPVIIEKREVKTLSYGDPMPAFELPDINGHIRSSEEFDEAEIIVVAFICNHCPTSQAYEDRLIAFTKDYLKKGVSVVAINPNSPYGLLPEECSYSDLDDSFETMAIRAEDKNYNFPYLYDGDNHSVSLKFGPVATPHFFVFDKKRLLRYNGRMDGVERPGTANGEDLRAAVDQLLAGLKVSNPETSSFGCSTKWSWNAEWVERINNDWNKRQVVMETIDLNSISELLKNNTNKLKFINIWASWCAPCVIELPELVTIYRYYGNRAFDLITISVDNMDKMEEALDVLTELQVPLNNYIFDGNKKEEFIELIDPEWRGALPYSIIIEPGGNVIYKNQGIVNTMELKKLIVEHPLMGRYY